MCLIIKGFTGFSLGTRIGRQKDVIIKAGLIPRGTRRVLGKPYTPLTPGQQSQ